MNNLEIIEAKYQDNYKIWIRFNDNKFGVVDFENDLWGNIFEPLKDISYFKCFYISEISNTLEWNNGADFAQEFIYSKLEK
jgi:hypothetical protein